MKTGHFALIGLAISIAGCKVNVDVTEGGDVRLPGGELCVSDTVCSTDFPADGAWIYPLNVANGYFFVGWDGCDDAGGSECFVVPSQQAVKNVKAIFSLNMSVANAGLDAEIINHCHSNYSAINAATMVSEFKDLNCDYKINNALLANIVTSLPMLENLSIYMGDVSNIDAIADLRHLKALDLSHNAALSSLSPLSKLYEMQSLNLWKNPNIPCSEIETLKTKIGATKDTSDFPFVVSYDSCKVN